MDRDRRTARRVSVDARVRIRAAGSSGRGLACRVRDASVAGIRLVSEQTIGADWSRVEVLTSSGQPLAEPLKARVVRTECGAGGAQEIGCRFD